MQKRSGRQELGQRSLEQRSLGRRLVALAAAYVIALSSLIASFNVASAAAADMAGGPGAVICHHTASGQSAPASDETNGKTCVDCCCVGCLMLMAAPPPPPTNAVPVRRSSNAPLAPRAVPALAGTPQTKSHRSRAPPLAA